MDSIGYNRSDLDKMQTGPVRLVNNETLATDLTQLTLTLWNNCKQACLSPPGEGSLPIQL